MKKLLCSIALVLGMAFPVMADAIHWKAGPLDLVVPFQTVNIISLYDFWHGQGLMGVETPVAKIGDLNINAGAVTSALYGGTPIISADYNWAKLIPNVPVLYLTVGVWYAYDFDKIQNMAGVKASAILHIF